ncbi:hypothetical protein JOC86_000447 [Bacillus pakistanensis]|uniref:Uncharacterized protein n=1 Tax=Rossellomorea pakistanensis TaxID=992288 RepID=A0ABS2N7S7_9BACI|nr:hypothetical protein [Bacillus pakistanensis]
MKNVKDYQEYAEGMFRSTDIIGTLGDNTINGAKFS